MDHELETIEHQMKVTRSTLAERAEALERQLFGMVHETTTAVNESVQSAKDMVDGAVGEIKESAHQFIDGLTEAFDLRLQVQRHPYAMICGSMALGYLMPQLIRGLSRVPADRSLVEYPSSSDTQKSRWPAATQTERAMGAKLAKWDQPKGTLTQAREKFDSEIHRLKELAIGAALGAVRDYIASSTPGQIGEEMSEIIDSFTTKVGGKPISGPVFSAEQRR
jgi:hypothetical protein